MVSLAFTFPGKTTLLKLFYLQVFLKKILLTAASTLAGDSSFGSEIIEITLNKIVSTV